VLAQETVDTKDNECTAILAILDRLAIKGALVTIDAIATNPTIAKAITDKGGDYILALKRNQPTLHDEVAAYFSDPATTGLASIEAIDKDHGRIETRTTTLSHDVGWLTGDRRHPGERRFATLATVIRTTTQVERKGQDHPRHPLLHRLGPPHPRARRRGDPQPLGYREPALGPGRHLQGRPVPPAPGSRRTEYGPRPPPRLQHGPRWKRTAIHQNSPKNCRMEHRRPQSHHHNAKPLTWTRCRGNLPGHLGQVNGGYGLAGEFGGDLIQGF
jgi:predicted transposase YbfD/YdcC